MRVWAWLSGEHPDLPAAEAEAVFAAEGIDGVPHRAAARLLTLETSTPRGDVERALGRLALTHEAGLLAYAGPYDETAIADALDPVLDTDVDVAVRATRVDPGSAWGTAQAERAIGAAAGRRVNLKSPAAVVRAFLGIHGLWLGPRWFARDPEELDRRHVRNRPFFSPVSLEPRWARTMVNLSGVRRGDLVVDPFCGTGGILLEAAAIGCRVACSDLDPEMVAGTRANLTHFGHEAVAATASDIVAAPQRLLAAGIGRADAVVTDLPYGRSASTGREARQGLYGRAAEVWPLLLRPGGRLVAGIPEESEARLVAGHLDIVSVYGVRVHRSLTRRFVVAQN